MTRQQMILAVLVVAAYLIGSIPFGLIIGLSRGIDPRKQGSGNIGATNVGRLLGGRFFALVFTLDMLKSLLPMLLAGLVAGSHIRQFDHSWQTYALWISVGLAAVLGHMFSIFLRFKGGKGVATSAGMMFGLYPYYTLPALVALLVVWRHRGNIARLRAGTEPQFKKKPA